MLNSKKKSRPIFFAFAAVIIGLVLSACGVKSAPQHPGGSSFPMAYPNLKKLPSINQKDVDRRPSLEPRSNSSVGIYQYPNSPSYKPPKE